MVTLPDSFLKWNYYPRRAWCEGVLKGEVTRNRNESLLDTTRHNPTLCTACVNPDGSVFVNGKIVGVGYVLKRKHLDEGVRAFKDHLSYGDDLFVGIEESKRIEKFRMYQRRCMELFLKYLYLEPEEAREKVDFTKLSVPEFAKGVPRSSKHTWSIVQRCSRASLVFYRPPTLSFELHGQLEIHENGQYHELVNLAHDSFHYTPPNERSYADRPIYMFNVEAAFDNSVSPKGWGTRIA